MDSLLMDMCVHPEFVEELLDRITEFNLAIVDGCLQYNIDARAIAIRVFRQIPTPRPGAGLPGE